MEIETWLMYSAFATANIISPGPAILLAISNGMTKGLYSVSISSIGNILGLLLLSGVAILGLGVVIKTSEVIFTTMKFIGACYLIYLGINKYRSTKFFELSSSKESTITSYSFWLIFKEGFLIAITNPKPILFFTALFPIFINNSEPIIPQFTILTITFMCISYTSLICYGILSKRIKNWFNSESKMALFNRIIGGLFIVMGLGMLFINKQ